jgi:hypothetical protein
MRKEMRNITMNNNQMDRGRQSNHQGISNQQAKVLSLLQEGPTNTIDFRLHGIMSPAARVMELRRMGHPIEKRKALRERTPGAVTNVAEYYLPPISDVSEEAQ